MARWLLTVVILVCMACGEASYQIRTPVPPVVSAPIGQARSSSNLPGDDDSVKFAVIGDTGTGGQAQYQVAERMAEAHARFPFEFVIMMGDNLYGSEGPRDYVNKFEKPYKALLDANVKFYDARKPRRAVTTLLQAVQHGGEALLQLRTAEGTERYLVYH